MSQGIGETEEGAGIQNTLKEVYRIERIDLPQQDLLPSLCTVSWSRLEAVAMLNKPALRLPIYFLGLSNSYWPGGWYILKVDITIRLSKLARKVRLR